MEFAINNSVQASTGYSPFYLNTGQHPLTPGSLLKPPSTDIPAADSFLNNISTSLTHAKTLLVLAQNRQKQYADNRRRELIFQPGDKVYLSTAHLPLPGRTQVRKLSPNTRALFPFNKSFLTSPTNSTFLPT